MGIKRRREPEAYAIVELSTVHVDGSPRVKVSLRSTMMDLEVADAAAAEKERWQLELYEMLGEDLASVRQTDESVCLWCGNEKSSGSQICKGCTKKCPRSF